MRKLMLLLFSIALVLGGVTMIAMVVIQGHKTRIIWYEAAGVMIFLGSYLLWTDFLRPGSDD